MKYLTNNTESARDRYRPGRVELTDVFPGVRLLHTVDTQEPGVSVTTTGLNLLSDKGMPFYCDTKNLL